MDLKKLVPLLPSLIPGVGGIIGTVGSIIAQNAQNRYNDPKRQLQRLNAAGLPYAAFAAGQSGEQSSLPDLSGIQKAGDSLGNFFEGYRQKEGLDLLKEQVDAARSAAKIARNNAQISDEEAKAMLDYGDFDDFGNYRTKARHSKEMDFAMKENAAAIQKNAKEISDIDTQIKRELAASGKLSQEALAKIDTILTSRDFAHLNLRTAENVNAAKNDMIERMRKDGLNFFESLMILAAGALGGSVGSGGTFNIQY